MTWFHDPFLPVGLWTVVVLSPVLIGVPVYIAWKSPKNTLRRTK